MSDPLPCIPKPVLSLMCVLEGKEQKASAGQQGQEQQVGTDI